MVDWKQILEFPNYEVSSDGRVRFVGGIRKFGHGTRYAPPAERSLQPHSGGYLQVRLGGKNLYVHRLVALAFIPLEETRDFVNHKSGDKTDNRVENLEWVTFQENVIHKINILGKGRGETHHNAFLTSEQVCEIRAAPGLHKDIAAQFGVARQTIGQIKSGRKWAHLTRQA